MAGIRLITFDLDNTLWPVDEVIRRAEQACGKWIAEAHPEASAVMSVERIRAIRDTLLAEHEVYRHNFTALRRDAMLQGFRQAGYGQGAARDGAEEALDVFLEARNRVVFFPGALEVLETLADSYTLGALSNGNADLGRIGIDGLFAFHHSAETVGRRKPEPDMFRAALESAGVRPDQALHVGDHPVEDVDAARRHGFHAIWANLLDLHWPGELDEHPHRVHNLHEITELLPLIDD